MCVAQVECSVSGKAKIFALGGVGDTGRTVSLPAHLTPTRAPGAGLRRRTLPPGAAFAGAALTFAALYLAAGAPTPLLVVFQQEWGFAPWVLTVAFATYAIGLLAALLVVRPAVRLMSGDGRS